MTHISVECIGELFVAEAPNWISRSTVILIRIKGANAPEGGPCRRLTMYVLYYFLFGLGKGVESSASLVVYIYI